MFDENGQREKLIIFTEHRDTLNYLCSKIRTLLGKEEAVVAIHGGMLRDERRKVETLFKQDKDVRILIATDAAGEGINLQRAHLMVNYDLPWNPNRLEQRFGRIHRIGQTEVCHLWNLVFKETREGAVFQRLFEKLEEERAALGGKVFDILGKTSFDNRSLRELLIEAIRYGNRPETRAKLYQVVDRALDKDACGPCVVLIDELVAYAKKLWKVDELPAGSFDNLITFIQEITEAARASKNSLVVASIPESNIEIGEEGSGGQQALAAIEHTFGRMEAIWKPVAANEGFEIVRRRLFLDCKDEAARNSVCMEFSRMYQENASDFPSETKEVDYYERMRSCYPIHPEIFDRLYEDWATIERFQKTRGVLRLMAAVVHNLWMNQDGGLLIMPGSISLDVSNIRDELTRHVGDNWNAIVDHEVDGKSSIPYQKDQEVIRFGKLMAARRVARTVMLGSAPSTRSDSIRGLETSRIRLGAVQPGENIATFNDALNTLQTSLTYLYGNPSSDRFWFDTRPTLRKTVEDRASQRSDEEVEMEIERRLKGNRKVPPFARLHVCPDTSMDVSDDQDVGLVILKYRQTYKSNTPTDLAMFCMSKRGFSIYICPMKIRQPSYYPGGQNTGMPLAICC